MVARCRVFPVRGQIIGANDIYGQSQGLNRFKRWRICRWMGARCVCAAVLRIGVTGNSTTTPTRRPPARPPPTRSKPSRGKSWLSLSRPEVDLWGTIDTFHTGSGYYSLDFDNVRDGGIAVTEVFITAGAGELSTPRVPRPTTAMRARAAGDIRSSWITATAYSTRYAHLRTPPLSEGAGRCDQGQQLGWMGNTGSSQDLSPSLPVVLERSSSALCLVSRAFCLMGWRLRTSSDGICPAVLHLDRMLSKTLSQPIAGSLIVVKEGGFFDVNYNNGVTRYVNGVDQWRQHLGTDFRALRYTDVVLKLAPER